MLHRARVPAEFVLLAALAGIALGLSKTEAASAQSTPPFRVAGGSNGAVQFNDHGRLGGDAGNLFWSKRDKRLGIGTSTPSEQLEITGNFRLPVTTGEGAGVIMSGADRFIHNFGTNNTFVGARAGNFLTSGNGGNTGLGANALTSNTMGECNTAIGDATLVANTIGDNNTAVGHHALEHNVDGKDNTASGVLALYLNTSGSRNTATGDNALVNNSVGYENTADGVFALAQNLDGYRNTATGFQALPNNRGGAANTASGYNALLLNYDGNDNVAIGWHALDANVNGYYNTGIGAHATVASADLHNATAIGALAVVDDSNKIRLGDDDVTVIEGRVPYTWVSDQNKKENFRPVDGDEVLRKIRGLRLRSWNYIGDDPQRFRHYGPVAQDFYAAFGRDEVGISGTPTTINSGDEAGVLMIAVQALERRTAEIEDLKKEIAELREMIRVQAAPPK